MGEKQNTSTTVEARLETDRTLAFIASETEQAAALPNAENALASWNETFNEDDADFFTDGNKQAVLALEIQGVDNPIIYYVRDSESPWEGPRVVYRLGPHMNNKGIYTDADDPANWKSLAIIDRVADNTTIPNNCPAHEVDEIADGGEPNRILDPSEDLNNNGVFDTITPNSPNAGFYACVPYDETNKKGRVAQLFLSRQLDLAREQAGTYVASRTISARADSADLLPPITKLNPIAMGPSTLTSPSCEPKPIGIGGDFGLFAMTISLEISSPDVDINGNVLMGPNVQLHYAPISPVEEITSTNGEYSQTTIYIDPDSVTVDGVQEDIDEINQAVAKAWSMNPTQTLGSITSDRTITGTETVNVILVEEIILHNQTLELDGGADDWFIINVKGDVKLTNGAEIKIAEDAPTGFDSNNIIFNVGGSVHASGGSSAAGTYLVPNAKAEFADASVGGGVIAAQVGISGADSVTVENFAFGEDGGGSQPASLCTTSSSP